MRRNWRANRILFFIVTVLICVTLILLSISGALTPLEEVLATPLSALSGVLTRVSTTFSGIASDISRLQSLQQRNADLEEALAELQPELVALREIQNDYNRLSELLNYTQVTEEQEFVAADVIALDPSGFLRSIIINKGTRDGIEVGMPVVTAQGLIGRISDVAADASRVRLITDENSAISARLQASRALGSVVGQLGGALRMTFIPLDASVQEGDVVLTSGLGGNLPADIFIGVVTSARQVEGALYQEAEVRSLVDFDSLEIVLVITSFQPIDISVFDNEEETP